VVSHCDPRRSKGRQADDLATDSTRADHYHKTVLVTFRDPIEHGEPLRREI
jgi:hypothetical protein